MGDGQLEFAHEEGLLKRVGSRMPRIAAEVRGRSRKKRAEREENLVRRQGHPFLTAAGNRGVEGSTSSRALTEKNGGERPKTSPSPAKGKRRRDEEMSGFGGANVYPFNDWAELCAVSRTLLKACEISLLGCEREKKGGTKYMEPEKSQEVEKVGNT